MKRENQQDATNKCLLLTSISTCFGHHYAHLQENKKPVAAFGVLFWFCWMWLVAVVGRCVVGCEHYPSSRVQTRPKSLDFSGIRKILLMPSFGEVKESVPALRHVKEPSNSVNYDVLAKFLV